MAKVKAMSFGYYKDRKVKSGEVFNMSEVDSQGYLIGADGKKRMGKDGKPIKCRWVSVDLKAKPASEKDPVEVAKAISGKNAGSNAKAEPEHPEEHEGEQPEAPAKNK